MTTRRNFLGTLGKALGAGGWDKEDRDAGPTASKLSANPGHATIGDHQRRLIVALVEGVIALGGGDRFDPTITEDDAA